MSLPQKLPSSFRDPSGFVFEQEGVIYRQVNQTYQSNYEKLMGSGLYDKLVREGLLIPHEEMPEMACGEAGFRIIRPQRVPYVSYPFEWCFSQLKDAALCTIRIQQIALEHGMVLKDASAYNIQFLAGRPVFIDTLSFDIYEEGQPWAAYKQYCQHFLGPLALMTHCDVRLSQLFRVYMDGPPLDLVSALLPRKTWWRYSLLTHVHWHARSQARYANMAAGGSGAESKPRRISALAFTALMKSIESAVQSLQWRLTATEWGDYYTDTNYVDEALAHKGEIITGFLESLPQKPPLLHDLGANNGYFSRIAARTGIQVVAQDIDPVAVEKNYLYGKEQGEKDILPLVQDLTNPSPDMGWQLRERDSLIRRCDAGVAMALALIHHLAIGNNVPLRQIAEFFAGICGTLIIEFVPKGDSQVERLLATREDIFPDYHIEGFEQAFGEFFTVRESVPIRDTKRTLYLLARK